MLLHFCSTFPAYSLVKDALTHSHTHSYTDGRGCHEKCQLLIRCSWFGVRCLAQGHFNMHLGGPGFEPAPFKLLDNLLYLLSYSHPEWKLYSTEEGDKQYIYIYIYIRCHTHTIHDNILVFSWDLFTVWKHFIPKNTFFSPFLGQINCYIIRPGTPAIQVFPDHWLLTLLTHLFNSTTCMSMHQHDRQSSTQNIINYKYQNGSVSSRTPVYTRTDSILIHHMNVESIHCSLSEKSCQMWKKKKMTQTRPPLKLPHRTPTFSHKVNDCLFVSLVYSVSFYASMYKWMRQATKTKVCGIVYFIVI